MSSSMDYSILYTSLSQSTDRRAMKCMMMASVSADADHSLENSPNRSTAPGSEYTPSYIFSYSIHYLLTIHHQDPRNNGPDTTVCTTCTTYHAGTSPSTVHGLSWELALVSMPDVFDDSRSPTLIVMFRWRVGSSKYEYAA